MFTSLVLINNIYHRQLILRTNYDSIHTNHVISSHLILLLSTFSTILFHFYIIFMLMTMTMNDNKNLLFSHQT